jgi:hypothetical protein
MKNLTFPALLLVLLILAACNKPCNQHQVAELRFTPEDLTINPYKGDEVLVFKSPAGGSVYFPAGQRKTENEIFYEYDTESAKIDHDGCQGDYYTTQYDWMVKSAVGIESRLDINLNFHYTMEKPRKGTGFTLYFWIKDPGLLCFWANYDFKPGILMNDSIWTRYPGYTDSIVALHPVLHLGPREFSDVYELYGHNPDHRDTAWICTAYYSIAQGLVGFKTTGGKTWYLDQ